MRPTTNLFLELQCIPDPIQCKDGKNIGATEGNEHSLGLADDLRLCKKSISNNSLLSEHHPEKRRRVECIRENSILDISSSIDVAQISSTVSVSDSGETDVSHLEEIAPKDAERPNTISFNPSSEQKEFISNSAKDNENEACSSEQLSSDNTKLESFSSKIGSLDNDLDLCVKQIFKSHLGYYPSTCKSLNLVKKTSNSFFPTITIEEMENYDSVVLDLVRDNDVRRIKSLHSSGRSFACCNKFGESLLHMACRRGFHELVSFLVEDAKVPIRITDDGGRTPLHDALWHSSCQFNIVDLLVRKDPALMLCCDERGNTPFAYARKNCWSSWKKFLMDRKEHIGVALDRDVMKLFR
mmetsp:Transcript_6287/g.9132  ORF Transcript_6287/g.9132 Transcript_6287/m.9132 type:complete len:354 (+) Transcript_6287:102-1163(+)|eukprot:CAMPEP_0184867112 /NCGR_PEP_ID=MMETSP0580-20130426/25051_1 /TAXON_ID=1118495 /ORGANISM="Dactyliosolen fragilissimus" /LENGTH=353 /DNA_ID=CAMNT_0027367161 /DNA_START=88 /DNA_END=1149 /DNA_ORIENTATION=+